VGSKKYIFLTNSLGGVSGGPSYVKNKTEWLRNNSWIVYAFDHLGASKYESIFYDTLKPYKNNRLGVLFFNPALFSESYRDKVIRKILKLISWTQDDDVVVESNLQTLAAWGEILSQRINAKHLIYLIAESESVNSDKSFDYFNFKFKRDELFFIKPQAAPIFFKHYLKLEEDQRHYWAANSAIPADNSIRTVFDDIPDGSVVITFFGRCKPYFYPCLNEVLSFAKKYETTSFLLLLVGEDYPKRNVRQLFGSITNVTVQFHNALFPVPQSLFDKSTVVIANAGCARISFLAGAITITIDVEQNYPLGVLGFTTENITYRKDLKLPSQSLGELLEAVIVNKEYTSIPLFNPFENIINGYDYQVGFVNDDREYWAGTLNRENDRGCFGFCLRILVGKLHFIGLGSFLRFSLYKIRSFSK